MKLVLTLLLIWLILCVAPCQAQWPYSSKSTSAGSAPSTSGTTFGGSGSSRSNGQLSGSPRYFPSSAMSPAPGVSSSSGIGLAPGHFFYFNNPGIGYYRTNPSASMFPVYPAPINLGGGYFQLGGMSGRMGYWRAPSGYYYPWCPPVFSAAATYPPNSAIYMMDHGVPAVAQPPILSIIADMREFIEDARAKKQLDSANYENLNRRLNELACQTSALAAKNGGSLTLSDDKAARRLLDLLSADLARALTL